MTDKKLLVQEVSSVFTMLLRLVYQAFEEICAALLEDDQEQILLIWLIDDFDGAYELQCKRREYDVGRRIGNSPAQIPHNHRERCKEQRESINPWKEHFTPECGGWWAAEPGMVRMVHGLANRVDRIRALGNGQVPIVAARAWETLTKIAPSIPHA